MSTVINEDIQYELALNFIPKIGPLVFRNILAYTGSARAFFEMPVGKALKIPRVNKGLLELRKSKDVFLKNAEEIINNCQKKGITILSFSHPSFPSRLKLTDDCPMVLFTKGNLNLNTERTIGIVGTRNATEYGRNVTKKIVEDLAPYSPTILSGLAYGVDIEAHRSALMSKLPTVAVLGSSVDQIYPSVHKNTSIEMLESGGLISEYPPGTVMHPSNFPKRNRIIAGLSDALIVVEAAQKGGALITAEIAYSYNKEVFAVPGNLQATYSEGCNLLIKQMKASIYTGPKDLEEVLSWSKEGGVTNSNMAKKLDLNSFEGDDRKVLEILQEKKELEIDSLALLSEIPISTLASKLLNFEFEGLIKSLPGKKYKLLG
ncbi:DNA-processing protein DprA [Arthrospiribacter ruber]|uniref:DNA-protecting protein DprA n=1 Tax=Arthrospiribacter ruber TaxID=2487934 RepID=A0A951MCB8_9BACT|nr:DNA-processing protein DprA [Arthrospiribacter ruber]MBW3466750.1 DNA-protecting protein DprA [Arthrospiribacter ruber]